MVRDLVLVDTQPARIRAFHEALAVYQDRLEILRARTNAARETATKEVERAHRAADALSEWLAARAQRRREPEETEGVSLHVFPSASEALTFLRRQPPYESARRPAVVFTELYVESEGAAAFVKQLKSDPDLCGLPTVVLCSNAATSRQVLEVWKAGSNAVVSLTPQFPGMSSRVNEMLNFWLTEAIV